MKKLIFDCLVQKSRTCLIIVLPWRMECSWDPDRSWLFPVVLDYSKILWCPFVGKQAIQIWQRNEEDERDKYIDALLLPFLWLSILSVSQCLKILVFTGNWEMWKGGKYKMFINIFFFIWRLDLSAYMRRWAEYYSLRENKVIFLSWITSLNRKVCFGWNENGADNKSLLGSSAFSALAAELPLKRSSVSI